MFTILIKQQLNISPENYSAKMKQRMKIATIQNKLPDINFPKYYGAIT